MTTDLIVKIEEKNMKTQKLPPASIIREIFGGRYLTVNEFAQIAGYHHSYVRQLIIKGKLKSYKVGRRRLIAVTDAVQFGSKRKKTIFSTKKALVINFQGKLTTKKRAK